MQPKVVKPMLPLFRDYTLDELHKRLGYSELYLADMKIGHRPPPPRFQFVAAGILNRTIEELFGGGDDEPIVQELPPAADSGGLDDSPLPQ